MRLVVQRVTRAAVRVGGEQLAEIGPGAVVLLGIGAADDASVANRMAAKLAALRYFADVDGRTNVTVRDVRGAFLVISQFTLYADVRKGRRPGFGRAAAPDIASPLVDRFAQALRDLGHRVETGRFGAAMEVELVNDGPFTLVLDSEADLGPGQ